MSRDARHITATLLLLFGGLGFLLMGPTIPACLGPLGVTGVECAARTGRVPEAGVGLPLLAACGAVAAVCLVPVPRRAWRRTPVAAAVVGGAFAVASILLRSRTIEGPGSDGRWYSVPVPPDPAVVAAAAIAGAGAGLVAVAAWVRLRAGR